MKKILLCILIFSSCNSKSPKEKNANSNPKNHLAGQFASKTNNIYRSFTFNEGNSVSIDFIGNPLVASYVIEVDTVRILTDKYGLTLTVKNDSTLIDVSGGIYFRIDSLPKNDSKHF